jgi:hypothetical protein
MENEGTNVRMEEMLRVVHLCLECSVEVGERLRGAAEAHALAEIIPPPPTQVAIGAIDPTFDGDAHADAQFGRIGVLVDIQVWEGGRRRRGMMRRSRS